jgi:hypothetical protein
MESTSAAVTPRLAHDLPAYVGMMLVAMAAGALFLIVGSASSRPMIGAGTSWFLSFVDTTARGVPIVVLVSAVLGYPLTVFLDRRGVKWYFSVLLAGVAGVCLGLLILVAAQFLDDGSGYLTFMGIYTLAAGAWCALWGTLLFHALRAHPAVGIVCGAVVVVAAAIRAVMLL